MVAEKSASVGINSSAFNMRHRDPGGIVGTYRSCGDGTQLENRPWHLVSDKEQNPVIQWQLFKTFFAVSQKS